MARVRTGTSDLTRTLAASPLPVYLLNSRRAIVYTNAACAAWLGVAAEDLLGARCDYHSLQLASQTQTIAAGLCPPPEAFSATHWSGTVTALHNGRLEERRADFHALPVPEEPAPALLAIVAATAQEPLPSLRSTAGDEPSSAELHVLLRWVRQSLAARPVLDRWIGDTPQVRRVREQFQAAGNRARVVVVGPRGSGRKDLARGIHYRQRGESPTPLISIDCAVVDPESLQIAITSLARHRATPAAPQAAALLLEEVDQLSADAQQELLGFLELPGFEVRTLATSQRELIALAGQGTFNRALAFALSTITIELPALTQRLGDLPLLAQVIVEELNAAGGKQVGGITSEALDRLAVYSWPGDVVQFATTIKEAWTNASGPQITLGDLPRWLAAAEDAALHPRKPPATIVLDDYLADVERELVSRALARVRGNKSKAAHLLGISRPRLLRRMEQLGLAPPSTTPFPEGTAEG